MARIAIIGRTQLLYDTALFLMEAGHTIAAVITAPDAPDYTRTERDFEALAHRIGASFFNAKTLDNEAIAAACSGLDLGISINWISIIGREQLDWFRWGILNGHMGDLPRYRGNACPNWAIINGEKDVVLSIHFMTDGQLDCGRIIAQDRLPLDDDVYIQDVYAWAEKAFPPAFSLAISKLETSPDYTLKIARPDAESSFRCYPRRPSDGFIDWRRSADEIHRLIRASGKPFNGAYTYQQSGAALQKLIIIKARPVAGHPLDCYTPGLILQNDTETGESMVGCGQGRLALQECRYDDEPSSFQPGKRWKTIRMHLGVRLEDFIYEFYQKKGRPN